MLAGMVNTSSHHNSPSCLVPPITTLCSELISCYQFFLPSLTRSASDEPIILEETHLFLQKFSILASLLPTVAQIGGIGIKRAGASAPGPRFDSTGQPLANLGKVQKDLTVPHHQKGSALSC